MTKLKWQRFILMPMFGIVFLCSCDEETTQSSNLISLGTQNLSQDDVTTYAHILRSQAPSLQAEGQAIYELTHLMVIDSLARLHGYTVTDTMLSLEAMRIDKNTLRPQIIDSIKQVCGDAETYKRLYIKENFYPRWVHEQFQWDMRMHSEQGDYSKSLFKQISTDPALFLRDSIEGYAIQEFHLSESHGLEYINPEKIETEKQDSEGGNFIDQSKKEDPAVQAQAGDQMTAKSDLITQHYLKAMTGLSPGEFHPQPLQTAEDFKILQYVKDEGEKKRIKMLSLPKRNYHEWLEKELKKIPITVHGRESWKTMLKAVPKAEKKYGDVVFG